jgi:hypothetical protein
MVRNRVFHEFWIVEQGSQHLEPELLPSVARPSLMRASRTSRPAGGDRPGPGLQRAGECLERSNLLDAVLIGLQSHAHQAVRERLREVSQRRVLLGSDQLRDELHALGARLRAFLQQIFGQRDVDQILEDAARVLDQLLYALGAPLAHEVVRIFPER